MPRQGRWLVGREAIVLPQRDWGHAIAAARASRVRGSEGAPHYAAARAGGCRSHGGGDRGRNAGSGGSSSGGAAAGACDRGPEHGARCVGGGAGSRRSLADADVDRGQPTRLGPQSQLQGEYVRGSEGASHYATARAGGCRSHSGGDRGRNAGSGGSSSGGAAAGACDRGPEDGARCVGGGAGSRSSEGTSGRGRGSEGASR